MDALRRRITALCAGWEVAQIRPIVAETLHEIVEPLVYAEATELIAEHRAPGTRSWCSRRPGSRSSAHRRARRRRPLPGHPHGDAATAATPARSSCTSTASGRPQAAREIAAARGYRLPDCRAYSDSITDLPLLEAVGHPTAVNPDRALRQGRRGAGWPDADLRRSRGPAPADPADDRGGGRRGRDRGRRARRASWYGCGAGTRRFRAPATRHACDFAEPEPVHPPKVLPCPGHGLQSGPRTSGRPGAVRQRSTRPPRPGLRVRGPGPPRAARRGRHVVVGLRIGTPDAEATITTRSARLDPGASHVGGRRPLRGAARLAPVPSVVTIRASAIERPSRAPASHCAQQCQHPRARQPRPRPRPQSAPKPRRPCPVLLARRRCPTSGTARPLGSSPVATAASRAAARATTPSAEPNGASASSSPWTTATTTGAGAEVPRSRDRPAARAGRDLRRRRGRPRSGSAARSAAASTCSRASACRGAAPRARRPGLLRDAHRPSQHRIGDGVVAAAHRPGAVERRRRPRARAGSPPPRSPANRGGSPGGCAARPARRGPVRRRRRRPAAPRAGRADRSAERSHSAMLPRKPTVRTCTCPSDGANLRRRRHYGHTR